MPSHDSGVSAEPLTAPRRRRRATEAAGAPAAAQGEEPAAGPPPPAAADADPQEEGDRAVAGPPEDGPPAVYDAHALLQDAVERILAQGRRPTAAAVALTLKRDGFAHTAVGHPTFRAFLRSAEEAGAVRLVLPTPGRGGDIEVRPASEPLPEPVEPTTADGSNDESADRSRPALPLRSDLWHAFVDWTPGLLRAVDRETGKALVVPQAASVSEPGETAAARRLITASTDKYLPVTPIGRDLQASWMAEFTGGLSPSPERDLLAAALRQERPLAAFAVAVRSMPALGDAWRAELTGRVERVIREWAGMHGVELDVHGPRPTRAPRRTAGPRPTATAADNDDQWELSARRRILDALERLPLADLLRLPIPAELLLRS